MEDVTEAEVPVIDSGEETANAVTVSPPVEQKPLPDEAQPTANDALFLDFDESPAQPADQEALDVEHSTLSQSEPAFVLANTEIEHSTVELNQPSEIIENLSPEMATKAGAQAQDSSRSAVTAEDNNPTTVDMQAFLETLNAPKTDDVAALKATVYNDTGQKTVEQPLVTQPVPTSTGLTANQESDSNGDVSTIIPTYQPNTLPLPPSQHSGLAPVLTTGANGLPPPPIASFQQPLPQTPQLPPGLATAANSNPSEDDNGYFPPELEGPYEEFLRDERANLNEGNWEKFPDGSRLFIGNLPTEKASKRDVFKKFYRYGKLAQVSMKQAFGFVQFLEAASCSKAKEDEQDSFIRGRRIHLEISRPNRGGKDRAGRRRSRSPDQNRSRVDRNDRGAGVTGARERDRDNRRSRDDYRPNRSSSPRGHRRGRSPDRYDARRRSRSRSPYRNSRGNVQSDEDDLLLPRRLPQLVPDVQIMVVEDLNREFTSYTESVFSKRGLRCDVLILSPRVSESTIIRRQVLEGVLAVVRLSRVHQLTGKIPLKLFNRSMGADSVKFEDYEDLDPQIAAELVSRVKPAPFQAFSPAIPSTPYSQGSSYSRTAGAPPQPDLSALLSQFSSRPELQSLLNTFQTQGHSQALPSTNISQGVSQQFLAALGGQQPATFGQSSASQPTISLASLFGAPAVNPSSSVVNAPLNAAISQPDMQEIMAQLSRYQRQ